MNIALAGVIACAVAMSAWRDAFAQVGARSEFGVVAIAALTPDRKTLVFRGTVNETQDGETVQNSDIFTIGTNGGNRIRLTRDAAFDGWPAVSPNGTCIAFASNRLGDAFHIYVMPIGGGEAQQLTFGHDFHYTQPAWSANGKSLAAFRWKEDAAGEVGHIVMIGLD
jgi:Tol biopolymer transport system component